MTSEEFAALKRDLGALRDELRLKMHLASMDLKTEWEKLEPQVDKVWREVSDASTSAAEDLKKRFLELKEKLKKQ